MRRHVCAHTGMSEKMSALNGENEQMMKSFLMMIVEINSNLEFKNEFSIIT
jgi:hypothetical protein